MMHKPFDVVVTESVMAAVFVASFVTIVVAVYI